MKDSYFKRKVEAIDVKEKSVSQLLAEMSKTALQDRKLGEAVEVWEAVKRKRSGHNHGFFGRGKIDEGGKRAVCYCDATIALQLKTHEVHERVRTKTKSARHALAVQRCILSFSQSVY